MCSPTTDRPTDRVEDGSHREFSHRERLLLQTAVSGSKAKPQASPLDRGNYGSDMRRKEEDAKGNVWPTVFADFAYLARSLSPSLPIDRAALAH